jgi:hypothetical protein
MSANCRQRRNLFNPKSQHIIADEGQYNILMEIAVQHQRLDS